MSKRLLQGRTQFKGKGKLYGRSRGPLVFNETVNRKVTQKLDEAIKRKAQELKADVLVGSIKADLENFKNPKHPFKIILK